MKQTLCNNQRRNPDLSLIFRLKLLNIIGDVKASLSDPGNIDT